jgi:hypothetical protein
MTSQATALPEGPVITDRMANHSRRWWILAVLGVAQLMVILDNTIVNIALPTAQHDLGFSNADRQWVVTAYALAFGSLLLLGGRIGDIFGRKRTLIIGLVGFAVASAIGGASVNFTMLVIARTIQGSFGTRTARHDVHGARRAGQGVRHLRRHRRRGRGHRTASRRHPHVVRLMALDVVREPRVRRHSADRCTSLAQE